MNRREAIRDYQTRLRGAISNLEKELKDLEDWLKTEAHYGDDFLKDPTAAGLSSFLGKMKKSSDLMATHIPNVVAIIETCPLRSVDFYQTTSPILRGRAKKMVDRCRSYDELVSNAVRPTTKRLRRVQLYFAQVYKNILKEVLIDAMQETYQKKRGDTKKTICGEPCEDGHLCQHLVWEGWTCPQHGGKRKDEQF